MALSPMMQQYMDIKEQYADCILFFRLGDFYEMFFDDAVTVSKELELILTGKSCGLEERAPMCGVPFHSSESYLTKLVEKGYKVAICEQVEDPAQAKGLVKRDVVRIVTPGTLSSSEYLSESENNYLCSVYYSGENLGFSYCDVSTGEIYASEFSGDNTTETLLNETVRIQAREILINEESLEYFDPDQLGLYGNIFINRVNETEYSYRTDCDIITRQFDASSPAELGIEENSPLIYSLGYLIKYITETQKHPAEHINNLIRYESFDHMTLDKATIRNLELTETLFEKDVKGSLLGVLDMTCTAMGSRTIKKWIREPLNQLSGISERLDAVEYFYNNILVRNNIRNALKSMYDFERIIGRIACDHANGKDLIALRNSCRLIPEIKGELSGTDVPLLKKLNENISTLSEVCGKIEAAICDEPPFTLREGGIIRKGYSAELDEINFSVKDSKEWIAGLEGKERERTGIKNLKVGFNKVFGYYLEITKSNYDNIPENYIRKQTLTNSERFITAELKEAEHTVLNAEVKINNLEYELFCEVRNFVSGYIREIQETSLAVAAIDVLCSFAEVSSRYDYVKPEINDESGIIIEKGRHPVIERMTEDGIFVSNDLYMDRNDACMLLITGPNMAGKSTYMRQNALIVLMAQAGCFVPCERAVIGIADRIFTRIGASDNLARGQSTFFVEMSELAYILSSATEKSLIILDEIGRGTSTYDGLSIAWATAEHLCRNEKRIRTLFATHYHEMTALEKTLDCLKNLSISVSEENGSIVFLHKIVEGCASRSYGIEVARLAGVPGSLLEAASEKLSRLENNSGEKPVLQKEEEEEEHQISMFEFAPNPVVDRLKTINLMQLTPSGAFKILEELKEAAEKE